MKDRLDRILVERGFFASRSRAAAAVLAGLVRVNGKVETRAGAQIGSDAAVAVEPGRSHVSRGGIKLERAFEVFPFDVSGKVVLDAGASTGGFTECLLRQGARKVIAVDVGYGQLDWGLRGDERVEVLERTNVRYLRPEQLSEAPDAATLDLSFISIKKVLLPVIKCLRTGFEVVALVKPQFEAGRGKVGKGGVVRDPEVHRQVLEDIIGYVRESGWRILGLTDSGLPGPGGNVEYLLYLADAGEGGIMPDPDMIGRVIAQARNLHGTGK